MTEIQQDAALAAGLLILELFDSSPGAQKHELLSKTVSIVSHALQEAARLQKEARHAAEPSRN